MQIKPIKIEKSSATVGYLILSTIAVISFALAFQDMNMLVFAVPLLVGFVIAASINKGKPEEDIIAIGYSGVHPEFFIPIGLIGGLIAIFVGSLIMEFSSQSTAALIPDFSGLKLAAVIPPTVALSVNLMAQWLIIAPSEEILARTVAPFAFMSLTKNVIVAYLAGSALWMLTHYPTFTLQNVPNTMYLVLAVLAAITLIVYFLTKSLFASIISHATFNSGVLILGAQINPLAFYTIGGISAVLAFVWLRGKK